MKRTTLRTSAIALGVAAALPATAQEWNLGWGGFIHQHVAFGSGEVENSANPKDAVIKEEGEDDVHIKVRIVDSAPSNIDEDTSSVAVSDGAAISFTTSAQKNYYVTPTGGKTADIAAAIEALAATDDGFNDRTDADEVTIYIVAPSTGATSNNQVVALNEAIADGEKLNFLKHGKFDGSGMHSNTEVHFTPSVTLDSGLTFGAKIEFEGDKEGVDQSFISVSSESLGTLKIGKHGKAGLGVHAPSVGIGINSGDHHNFIAVAKGVGATSGTNPSIIGTSDRISYTTPKNALGGFELGISYAPGGDDGNRRSGFLRSKPSAGNPGDLSDNIDVAMKFEQSLGDTSFALGMRYGTAKEEGAKKKPRVLGVGASVGFGGFTFGGSYADAAHETPALSSSGWNLGASYNMEAWTFGIETFQGEADDGDEHSVSKIAASWALGPGVAWDFYAVTASSTHSYNGKVEVAPISLSGSTTAPAKSIIVDGTTKGSGNAFGTAIKLTF